MMPESPTAEPFVVQAAANVPHLLHSRLVEEAHLRVALAQATQALREQAAAVGRLEGGSFPLGGLLRKVAKKPEGPELQAARSEEMKLAKTARRLEDMSRKLGAEVETLVDVYLADTLPDYAEYRDARKKLQPWEQAVAQFQGRIGKLVELLGQARNMASAGYDKKRKVVSDSAKALIDRSADAVKAVAKLAEVANQAGRSLGQAAEVRFDFRGDELARLEKMEIGAMQAEFDRLIAICEGIQKNEAEVVKAGGLAEADTKLQQASAYLADYVAQIRQYTDERHVVPDEVGSVVQRLEARWLVR